MKKIFITFFCLLLVLGCLDSGKKTTTTILEETTTTIKETTTQIQTAATTTQAPQATTTQPTATCSDGIKNQGEGDIDCGGPCKICAIVVDKPPEYKTKDYWQYMTYEVANGEEYWAIIKSYTGKANVGGNDYDEFEMAYAIITETQEVQTVGSSDLSHMHTEDGKVYLDRDVEASMSGSPTVFKYTPGMLELRFPLKTGEKWSGESDMTWIYTSKSLMTLPVNYTTEVVGEEKVTVKAGTFDTLKIVETLDFVRHGELAVRKTTTRWYSPKVKNYVKINTNQEVIGPTDTYRAQQGSAILTFGEYNITNELMLYTIG